MQSRTNLQYSRFDAITHSLAILTLQCNHALTCNTHASMQSCTPLQYSRFDAITHSLAILTLQCNHALTCNTHASMQSRTNLQYSRFDAITHSLAILTLQCDHALPVRRQVHVPQPLKRHPPLHRGLPQDPQPCRRASEHPYARRH